MDASTPKSAAVPLSWLHGAGDELLEACFHVWFRSFGICMLPTSPTGAGGRETAALLGVVTTQAVWQCTDKRHDCYERASSERSACGLVKWCRSVDMLLKVPSLKGRAEAAVITNDAALVRLLCPASHSTARILPFEPRLVAAVERWTRHLHSGNFSIAAWSRQVQLTALYKWQIFAHVEYKAIFFTDIDADLLAHSWQSGPSRLMHALHATWTSGLDEFLAQGSARLVASNDFHSPINTGVMLAKPSRRVFEEGLAVLQRGSFDRDHGFDAVGRPQQALAHLAGVAPKMWSAMQYTVMVRKNDWSFTAGHADQGLFVYLFLAQRSRAPLGVRFPTSSLERRAASQSGMMRVHHFTGGSKPWRQGARAVCSSYFRGLGELDGPALEHARALSTWPRPRASNQGVGAAASGSEAHTDATAALAASSTCYQLLSERRHCVLSHTLSDHECHRCGRYHAKYRRKHNCTGGVIESCPGILHLVI